MSALKRVKLIDQRNKDIIFGFIRKSNEAMSNMTIPIMINYICLLYYYIIPEKFIRCPERMVISSSNENEIAKNDVATVIKYGHSTIPIPHHFGNLHGNLIINPRENHDMIATWSIKVGSDNCIIGIHSKYEIDACYTREEAGNYGWWGKYGAKYGGKVGTDITTLGFNKFKTGDTVKMEFNVKMKLLRFYRNGTLTNVVFDGIDISLDYHLMIRMMTNQSMRHFVQIIDFEMKGYKSLHFYEN